MKRRTILLTLLLLFAGLVGTAAPARADLQQAPYQLYFPVLFAPETIIPLADVLQPFDANQSDLNGPGSWWANYGKSPEIVVVPDGDDLVVLAQDYDATTPWKAVLLRLKPRENTYQVVQALTDLPMLDRVMGLAVDESGNRYYATGVDEDAVVNATYPPLNTYRSNIVRVVKVDRAGTIIFNTDLDLARQANNPDAEMIVNPMVAATARLAVGGNEVALVHGINTDPDPDINGVRHQKALSTRLDATTGAVTRTSSSWVSHSFDQRLLFDGESISEYHLGDAYPRYLVFSRNHKSFPVFHVKGALGDNKTFTRLGNLALIENDPDYRYLALFATEESQTTAEGINGPRNLAITRVKNSDNSLDTNLSDTLTVTSVNKQQTNYLRWLTRYTAESNLHAERPKLVAIGNDRYIVLWEEWRYTGGFSDEFRGVYAMLIDASGATLRPATLITNADHLHRGDDAFALNGRAGWITGNRAARTLEIHFVDENLSYQRVVVE